MSNRKALPDFLIIGAMKAGTTTLYRDLVVHPDIFLPQEKEPDILVRHGEDELAIAEDYRSLFRPAKTGQLLGEASTAYSKRPDHEGVALRARKICGPALKLIYITREPIGRLVSQYRHEAALGLVTGPLNDAVLREHRFVDYSRYDWQLDPWIEAFGAQNILVLRFEDYIADRAKVVAEICAFLGVPFMAEADFSRAFNTAEGKAVPKGIWKRLVDSRLYQRQLKPLLPIGLRERMSSLVLTPAEGDNAQLTAATRDELLARLDERPVAPVRPENPERIE